MTLTIRKATEADIPVLRDLSERIWREYYPKVISMEQIDYMLEWMYSAATIRSEMEAGLAWELVLHDATPVGFISCEREADSSRVKLHKLYLLPSLHGQGLGQQMLAHVKTKAVQLGARELCLRVNKRNFAAIRAYERAGFRRAESVTCEIGGGFVMDDYIMAFDLSAAS